jgi:DNA-binding beta-propeller fold protein YncE
MGLPESVVTIAGRGFSRPRGDGVMRKAVVVPVLFALPSALLFAGCGGPPPETAQKAPPSYHLLAEISIGGDVASWDYLSEDLEARRLYVSNGTRVVVIDMDSNTVVGEIPDLPGVHGFAVAHDLGRGFASDGRENKVAVVDLNTLEVLQRVDTGDNPDGILYVPDFQEVYAFNGRGHSATVIAAATGEVLATIPLSGKPEFAVFDPEVQRIYNNIEDQNEIAVIDPVAHEVVTTWPIAPGEAASGLAIDLANHRLFAVCENEMMVMLDSRTGEVVTTVPIGGGVDAARFDPGTGLAFSSNGEGTVTIAHEVSPSELAVVQTLETASGARTMTLDPTTHRIYLSTADFEQAPAADSTAPRRRGPMVPGSFRVLVYGTGS